MKAFVCPKSYKNMVMLKNILLSVLSVTALSVQAGGNGVERYVVRTDSPEQTMLHFGASDAWSMQFVGLWPDAQQQQIADWLFSTENDATGKPKGIGLSIWRFNLGAGSEEQGDAAQIQPGTRTECFLKADGTYDWTKQPGQRRFMHLAKERGVPYLLAFLDSPPVYFTQNGLATNTGRGGTLNLREDCYDDFAEFMATAVEGLEKHDGIHIDYISPLNEPDGHWNWLGPKQEGTPATTREVARVARELDKQISKRKLGTKIIVNESSDLRCLLGTHMTDWQRANELYALFSPDSTDTYLGKCKNVLPLIAAHSYWTNTPLDFMREIRMTLRDTLKSMGLDYWQTELCIMSNDEEIGGGGGYDHGMKTALYVARVIHHDLVYGNARSWSWWRSIGGDYKDGLIRVYSNDGMKSGWAVDSKLMWSLGNYSRFVRPGAVRYDVDALAADGKAVPEGDTDVKGVMCSAFKNTDGRWVVVAINYSEDVKPFDLSLSDGNARKWQMYRTSDVSAESLMPVGTTEGKTVLAPRSITTFVARP